jgi:hypothetical protein
MMCAVAEPENEGLGRRLHRLALDMRLRWFEVFPRPGCSWSVLILGPFVLLWLLLEHLLEQ